MHTASFAILLNTQTCLADEDQEAGKHRGEQGTHRPFSARIIIQDHGGLARNRTQIEHDMWGYSMLHIHTHMCCSLCTYIHR